MSEDEQPIPNYKAVREELISINKDLGEMLNHLDRVDQLLKDIYNEVQLAKEIKIALALKKAGENEGRNSTSKTE